MEARPFDSRVGGEERLTARAAALALMFNEVPVATDRLALCLRTQRRIGAAHTVLHLRRLASLCLHEAGRQSEEEMRCVASSLARPLKELDDALAADRLEPPAMAAAERNLSFVRFQLWRLERLSVVWHREARRR